MNSDDEKKSLIEQYIELSKSSLIKVQYSCGGISTGIDETDYFPIFPEASVEKNIFYKIAIDEDMESVVELLKKNNLPVDDLNTGYRTFIVANLNGRIIGCVALETYNDSGLLRSLVVENNFRSKGIAHKLMAEVEAWTNGLNNLYLLTTTASGFFLKIGWKNIERSSVPESIALSSEFATVCPSTAICMTKTV